MAPTFRLTQAFGLVTHPERSLRHWLRVAIALLGMTLAGWAAAQAPQSRYADANGVRMHYLVAGQGDPVILLHGYAQTSGCRSSRSCRRTTSSSRPTCAASATRPCCRAATPSP